MHLLHWERLPRLLHLLHHLLRLLLHELLHGLLLLLPVDKLLHRLLLLHELPLLPKLLLPKLLLIALLALRAPRHLVVSGATFEAGATRTGVLVLAVEVAAPIVATIVVVAATATATTTTIAAIVAGVVPPLSLLLCLHELLYLLLQRLHFGEWSCGLKLLLHLRLLLPNLRRTLSDCVHPPWRRAPVAVAA